MACCKGSSSIAAILGVVGVVAVGIGGFNFVRTGCPLGIGSCDTGASEAAITTVAETTAKTESSDACCSTGVEKAIEDCCGLCPEGAAKKAALIEASSTSEAKAGSCEEAKSCEEKTACDGAAQAAVVEAAAKTESKTCEDAKSCDEAKSCNETKPAGEATAQSPAAPATAG